jgi:LPXTG-motif cell wall-anchored protein
MSNTPTRKRLGIGTITAGLALLGFGALAPTANAQDAPAGNNGTIKVDGVDFDTHPNNEPHPGCIFQIDFYGFDALTDVTMVFDAQPPTGGFEEIYTESGTLDDDDNSGGGSEAGLDGQFTIDLSDELASSEPHPNQGYHVKLTITADDHDETGAQSKHKVFWVDGCGDTGGTTGGNTDGTTGVLGTSGTIDGGTTGGDVAPQTQVKGAVVRNELPRTGDNDASLAIIGAGLIAIGGAVLLARRETITRS